MTDNEIIKAFECCICISKYAARIVLCVMLRAVKKIYENIVLTSSPAKKQRLIV